MTPRWLSWLFVAVLGYMVYAIGQSNRAAPVAVAPVVTSPNAQQSHQALAEFADIEAWKRSLNPEYAATHNCSSPPAERDMPAFHSIEEVVGVGEGARCGDSIEIILTLWGTSGTVAHRSKLTLALGTRSLAAGLDAGLVGIRPQGKRLLILPAAALTRNPNAKAPAGLVKAFAARKLVLVSVERIN